MEVTGSVDDIRHDHVKGAAQLIVTAYQVDYRTRLYTKAGRAVSAGDVSERLSVRGRGGTRQHHPTANTAASTAKTAKIAKIVDGTAAGAGPVVNAICSKTESQEAPASAQFQHRDLRPTMRLALRPGYLALVLAAKSPVSSECVHVSVMTWSVVQFSQVHLSQP